MHSWAHSPPVPTANLTGHEEKVSVENFELLKVLGTGGEDPPPAGQMSQAWCPGPPAGTPAWAWARPLAMPPTLSRHSLPCLLRPALPGLHAHSQSRSSLLEASAFTPPGARSRPIHTAPLLVLL